jgi:hypothetical protein
MAETPSFTCSCCQIPQKHSIPVAFILKLETLACRIHYRPWQQSSEVSHNLKPKAPVPSLATTRSPQSQLALERAQLSYHAAVGHTAQHSTARHGTAWHGTARHGTAHTLTDKKLSRASPATARARSVLLQPGGPNSSTPRGGLTPRRASASGERKGAMTTSCSLGAAAVQLAGRSV